jgi:Flp pilus assembly protein TadD
MNTTHVTGIWVSVALVFAATGCGAKKKTITELQRKESAHLASDAQFALTVRDYARAETSLAKAVELTPDEAVLWVSLGAARIKQGKRDAAKEAYKHALSVHETEAKADKTDPEPWLKQVYVLGLLGRKDDARALLEKATKQFPEHRNVKAFVEGKQLDRMLGDSKFKEMAL